MHVSCVCVCVCVCVYVYVCVCVCRKMASTCCILQPSSTRDNRASRWEHWEILFSFQFMIRVRVVYIRNHVDIVFVHIYTNSRYVSD
jgi:hypothetical protein